MSSFKFVSHESFPEDPYISEIVYLCFDDKYRVAYARKSAKNGGQFWTVLSAGVVKDGVKKYFEAFMQDSLFLDKDVKHFLDNRSWKSEQSQPAVEEEDAPF